MLRICAKSLSKHFHIARWHGRVFVAHLQTQHGPPHNASVVPPPEGLEPVESHTSRAESGPNVLSPLIRTFMVGDITGGPITDLAGRPSPLAVFTLLSHMLSNENLGGTTLWYFVKRHCTLSGIGGGHVLTESQKSLLGQVLRRVLEEWSTQESNLGTITLTTVLRFYIARNFMRRIDWIYCLGFLARYAYRGMNLHRDLPLEDTLVERIRDATNLRILCKLWKMFLLEEGLEKSEPMNYAKAYENLLPQLRKRQARTRGLGSGTDFVRHFVNTTTQQYSFGDSDLDRHLAYTSVLTLVAIYTSVRTHYLTNLHMPKGNGHSVSQSDASGSGDSGSSEAQPNWHLGRGQSTYWTPEISHFSVNEALILYVIAQAAKETMLNATLLRITLAQMSLPESDALEIARIYQGFQLAVPTIMTKFQKFEYDKGVYQKGLLRRYPLKTYLQRAIASNDSGALEYAGAVVGRYGGAARTAPGDALALVKAFLQMDLPRRALHYWNVLAQRAHLGTQAWQIWLDYVFTKKDHIAFETAWDRTRIFGIPRTSKMWYQRLVLLHHADQSWDAAWAHFCTLLRFSGRNKKLIGAHMPSIAPSSVEIEIFHMMIRSYLEKMASHGPGITKAKDTLELLKTQEGLGVTRETYSLFVTHFLKTGARQSAIKWFLEGKSQQVQFSPEDYALLFEYDLVRRDEGALSPLSDFTSDVRLCFGAISDIMRLLLGRRLFEWSSRNVSHWSSEVETILKGMPLVGEVTGDLEDPKKKEIQSAYAGIMLYLARNFPEQASGRAKTARLRLLLLLWDHCIIMGIPASTVMESTLHSTICSLHPGLQERLMRGALFNNYDVKDPSSFYSYRFLQRFGRQWLSDRISSIPPGPMKSQIALLPWRGYEAVSDDVLNRAGIASQVDRRKILDEIVTWKIEASTKRAEMATKKKERKTEVRHRKLQLKELAERYDDMAGQLKILEKQQADEIQTKKQTVRRLEKELELAREETATQRLVVIRGLRSARNGGLAVSSTRSSRLRNGKRPYVLRSKSLRSDPHALRKQSSSGRGRRSMLSNTLPRMAEKSRMVPATKLRRRFRQCTPRGNSGSS
jgi:hypothetical protein